MDPKSTLKQPPAAQPKTSEPNLEVWEPAFVRWQRITETLISRTDHSAEPLTDAGPTRI